MRIVAGAVWVLWSELKCAIGLHHPREWTQCRNCGKWRNR